MDEGPGRLRGSLEESLWPLVETFLGSHDVAGLAVAVVREDEVVSRGFGVRDVGSGAPVTPETMFHLASVSKPFVATAIVSLATARDAGEPVLDLDAPITEWVPEFTLADGRAGEVTARRLLSHTSGLPDVSDYGWHDPQLGDDALSEFARSLSGWRLQAEPGSAFSYSNAGFELLGLLLSRVHGHDVRGGRPAAGPGPARDAGQHVPAQRGARAPGCLTARGDAADGARGRLSLHQAPRPQLDPALQPGRDVSLDGGPLRAGRGGCWGLRRAVGPAGRRAARAHVAAGGAGGSTRRGRKPALGWAVGSYRGHRTLSHSGADPGFGSRLVLVPERRTGVVVLANSNTVPTWAVAAAALDIALADPAPRRLRCDARGARRGDGGDARVAAPGRRPRRRGVGHRRGRTPQRRPSTDWPRPTRPSSTSTTTSSRRPCGERSSCTARAWSGPSCGVWTALRPDSSTAWTMTGWAHQVDGQPDLARTPPPTRPRPRPRERRRRADRQQPALGMNRSGATAALP